MRTRSMLAPRIALGCFAGAVLYASASHAAPIGWIDGGYWANGQFNVSGWGGGPGSARAGWGSPTGPPTGGAMGAGLAEGWGGPAGAPPGRGPRAAHPRINIPPPPAVEEAVGGQPIP